MTAELPADPGSFFCLLIRLELSQVIHNDVV